MPTPRLITTSFAFALLCAACSQAPSTPATPPAPAAAPADAAASVAAPADPGAPPPASVTVEAGGVCNIEMIGDVSDLSENTAVPVASSITVSGWRTLAAVDGAEARAWLRVLADDGSVVFQAPLPATEDRPDVQAAAGRASALRSGFRDVGISGLPSGRFTLDVVLDAGSQWVRCAHTRKLEVT